MNSEIEELKALLKVNGVVLPPAPPERPVASIEDIPPERVLMMLKLLQLFLQD